MPYSSIRSLPALALAAACLAPGCSSTDELPLFDDSSGGSDDTTTGVTTQDLTTGVTAIPGTDGGDSSSGGSTGPADSSGSGDEATTTGSTSSGTEGTGDEDTGTTTGVVDDDTVYEVQDGTIGSGTDVELLGVIVTGIAPTGLFVQEPAGGPYSGVYVFTGGAPAVAVGDEVDVTGTTTEFSELTEVDVSGGGSVNPTGVGGMDLAPSVVAVADLDVAVGEPWEGVLVRIEGTPLTVVNLPGFSEFDVSGGGPAAARIDNFLYSVFDFPATYPAFGVDASFTAIQGPVNFTFGAFKVAPRGAADLEGYVAGPGGNDLGIDELSPGDLVVTEVMFDPNCGNDDCEWIEVYNASGGDVNLNGLRIQDSQLSAAAEGTIIGDLVVAAGGYVVLAKNTAATWPYAAPADGYYGGLPAFNNTGGDLVALLNSTEILDQTATYPTFGASDNGRSWKLAPAMLSAVANDVAGNWCFSTMVFDSPGGVDEYGTPGGGNEAACAAL